MDTLSSAIAELALTLDRAALELPRLPNTTVEDRWSRKQILGHLIDSASNNHQRFVRAQLDRFHESPGYVQDSWVGAQRYEDREWSSMVDLWLAYNRHLLHVMKTVAPQHLSATMSIHGDAPVALEFVMVDYVRHLKHHLQQIGTS